MPKEKQITEMVDVAFALEGDRLPGNPVFALWRAVVQVLPWLEDEPSAGIMPLRAARAGDAMLLPKRARMIMRLPAERVAQAQKLSGQVLDIEGHTLTVGAAKARL